LHTLNLDDRDSRYLEARHFPQKDRFPLCPVSV